MSQENLEARIRQLEQDQKVLAASFAKLNNSVDENTDALREFIALGQSLKFGIKVLGIVERMSVWITKVALAMGTVAAIWKFVILETIRNSSKTN